MKEEKVRFQNVTMSVEGNKYLDNMSFYMLAGEVMGVVASRDKGREEFIQLLRKNSPIDYGRIFIDGNLVNSYSHSSGTHNKVYLISKKSSLIEGLSVTDNIFVIRKGFRKFIIEEHILRKQLQMLVEELGFDVKLDKSVSQYTPLERCEAEILKAYIEGCSLIVLIDLSEFMGQMELEQLYKKIQQLKVSGNSFLYICNHHEEAFRICDRVSLYSNGRIKKVFEKPEMTDEAIAPYIMNFNEIAAKRLQKDSDKKLEFRNIYSRHLEDLSFFVKEGECLTLLDSDNLAAEEIVQILTGKELVDYGTICYERNVLKFPGKEDILKHGIVIVPENPQETYLFTEQSYMENLTFLLDKKLGKMCLKTSYLKSIRKEYMELSRGGVDERDIRRLDTQQKCGLAYFRVLLYHPAMVILVRPVAHGDMICRGYILVLIGMLKDAGITVLILAGSISDNLYVSDRLVVLKNGKSIAEFNADEFRQISR